MLITIFIMFIISIWKSYVNAIWLVDSEMEDLFVEGDSFSQDDSKLVKQVASLIDYPVKESNQNMY